jgi:hypothetical protein
VARRRDVSLSIAIALFALAVTAIRIYSRVAGRSRRASGTVVLMGTSLGSTQFSVEDCKKVEVSGGYPYGADLVGSDRYNLRLVRQERDDEVQLSLYPKGNPGAAVRIDRGSCSQWRVSFFWEDPRTLDLVGGDADFTCAFAGGKIDATVFAEHCRP